MTEHTISTAARAVLAHATIAYNTLYLSSGQLPRPLYEEVNEVLTRLGGTWQGGKIKGHVFEGDPTLDVQIVIQTGLLPPKNPTAFYPTPGLVIHRMLYDAAFGLCRLDLDLARDETLRLLEPSAGRGALAFCLRDYTRLHQLAQAVIHCCEIVPAFAAYLRAEGFEVVAADFLAYQPAEGYHAILMNPPFRVESDALAYITHIEHAWSMLLPGGLLTAIAPSSFTFRTDQRARRFRLLVETHGLWEPLPHDTFAAGGSGTPVQAVLLSMRKPRAEETGGALVRCPHPLAPTGTWVNVRVQPARVAQEMLPLAV